MGKPEDAPRTETTRLGSYEIVRKLARGGMAELFLARTVGPEGFEKLVVLKKILPSHAENPKFVRLFLDEAKLAATLDHPHIAHVYDMGKVDGNYFFTMEYVHGQDVRTTLRRTSRLTRRFPIDHAVQIARNVAAALHYAHERRRSDGTLLDIVHRDVSPSNIIVSYDGAVKLVDFGVAKAATSTVKTRTGTLKGKISYMSPEQAKGSPIDRRSDIFSLGILLWEMVTTQRLFKSDNDLATIQMIINSKPQPPGEIRPECPPELERVILKALANKLEDRYQTAEQLQLDLEELAREQKLKQSSVALRTWMHEMFAEEIKAWSLAQASGQTLTEHIAAEHMAAGTEMTTPVSESELEFDDYMIEDDEEEAGTTGQTGAPTKQMPSPLQPSPTTQVAVPPPPRAAALAGPSVVVSEALTAQMPVSMIDAGELADISTERQTLRPNHTPFPIAPPEWRASMEQMPTGPDPGEQRKKRIIIGCSITFGVVVIIAIAFGGGSRRTDAEQAPPTSTRVEMQAEPPATPVEREPEPGPAAPAADESSASADTVAPPLPAQGSDAVPASKARHTRADRGAAKAPKADKPPPAQPPKVDPNGWNAPRPTEKTGSAGYNRNSAYPPPP